MTLKLRIRKLRQERGWSLETLAGKVGISTPHMSQVERGLKRLNDHLIEKISGALDVEPYELLAPRQDEHDILHVLAQLSDEDRARVRDFAEALSATRKDDGEK